jgi:hypothetical protein
MEQAEQRLENNQERDIIINRRLGRASSRLERTVDVNARESLLGVIEAVAATARPAAEATEPAALVFGLADEGGSREVGIGTSSGAGAGAGGNAVLVGVLAVFGGLPEGSHVGGRDLGHVGVVDVSREEGDQRVEILVVDTGFASKEMLEKRPGELAVV